MKKSSHNRMIIKTGAIALYFFFALISIAQAIEPYTPDIPNPLYEEWRWTHFQEISRSGVRSVIEGEENELWFATANGVIQYDGLQWIEHSSQNEILQSPVYGILKTSTDVIYAVSLAGICHFENGTWTTDLRFPPENVLGDEWEILNLRETSNGDIWVGLHFGLVKINDQKVTLYTSEQEDLSTINESLEVIRMGNTFPETSEFVVFDLLEDQSKNLWLALENGNLLTLRSGQHDLSAITNYSFFSEADGLLTSRLPILHEMKDGRITLITQSIGGGINFYDPYTRKWQNQKLSEQFGGDDLNFSIHEFEDGRIWVGGFSRFFEYKEGNWQEYKQPDLPVPQTRIVFTATSDGSMWIAGLMADVFRIEYQTPLWNTYKNLNYECQTADGKQWFIAGSGDIVSHNPQNNNWERVAKEEIGIDVPVRIFKDSTGFLWVLGSKENRAALAFNHWGIWETRAFPELCWGFSPTAAFQDSEGAIWFSASTDCGDTSAWGLIKYDPSLGDPLSNKAWKKFPGAEICEVAYALGETDAGSLLCGYYKGLYEYAQSTTRSLHNVLVNDMMKIECIEKDKKQGLWIGTRSKGLMHFVDETNWTLFSSDDGLPSNTITGLLVAADSTIWVATDKGIARYDGETWQSSALPGHFKISRGGGTIRQSPDGTIWVNRNSVEWYRREYYNTAYGDSTSPLITYKIQLENLTPEATITQYDPKVYYPGNTTIYWEGRDRWNQSSQDEITFSYKLDDEPWSDFSSANNHTFLELKRGKHTLQVRARDKYLNVDPHPDTIEIKRIPPIWGQIWFILLAIVILGSLAYLFLDTVRKGKEMEKKNQEMESKNQFLTKQQEEIEEKSKQIMQLLETERANKWVTDGIVQIGETIRQNRDDTRALANGLLETLTKYLGVQYGGFFIHHKISEKEEYLELIASHAFDQKRNHQARLGITEGLTGACFTDKKTMKIDNLPDSYVIESGLGKSRLQTLLLIPLKLHGEVTGVLEIGSMENIDDRALELLETVAQNIAGNLLSLETRGKIEKLYSESQKQTALLHEQEEEMRQQMEELQATQEESHRREMKLQGEIEKLKKKLAEAKKG